jgi:hypothetical protein
VTVEPLPSYRPLVPSGDLRLTDLAKHCARDGMTGPCWGQVEWREVRQLLRPNGGQLALCEGHRGPRYHRSTLAEDALHILSGLTPAAVANATHDERIVWALGLLRAVFEAAGATLKGWKKHAAKGVARYSRDGRWVQVCVTWRGPRVVASLTVDGADGFAVGLRAAATRIGLETP